MIELLTSNLEEIGVKIEFQEAEVVEYLNQIKAKKQGFLEVLEDEAEIEEIEKFVATRKSQYKQIVVLGIGGSALGTKMLKSCLQANSKELWVLDNIDADEIFELHQKLVLRDSLFIVVSKSGNTVETVSQYFYFREAVQAAGLEHNEHFVFITDENQGLLRKISLEMKTACFGVPANLGGRFSVLSAVALLPAKLMGVDVRGLREGARSARESFLEESAERNVAYRLAKIQYELCLQGKNINVLMPYSSKLFEVSPWYAQLLAESIGKDGLGITPVVAKGVTDQHSQNQLFNDGPDDKLIMFLEVVKFRKMVAIPNFYLEEEAVAYLGEKSSFNELMRYELQGTEEALTSRKKANIKLQIEQLDAKCLGELLFMLQGSIAFLGEMFKVNAFDQPGVELSKQLTRKYYERKT